MKEAWSGVVDFLHTKTKHCVTMQENTRHLSEVGQAGLGCRCWWLHLRTGGSLLHVCALPGPRPEHGLVGEEALIEA